MQDNHSISVVIPCYKVRSHILGVIEKIGPEVDRIYAVDDQCPENTGDFVEANCADSRVTVLRHARNGGVGAATLTGMKASLRDGIDIVVKLDGDGQMDPAWIPVLVRPILERKADYTKGSRFFSFDDTKGMPMLRVVGNAGLSFLTKLASGYWTIFDPTNGYIAIHRIVLDRMPLDRLHKRYFFESDLLFRAGTVRAVVLDVPMPAIYGDEVSNLKISKAVPQFFYWDFTNFAKRIFYNYYLRDFNMGSLLLVAGIGMLIFGLTFGAVSWAESNATRVPASAGTVMLAALPMILGLQCLISFANFDMVNAPRQPLVTLVSDLHGPRSPAPSGEDDAL